MPPIPKKLQKNKKAEQKSFRVEKKGRGLHFSNLLYPKQRVWVCAACKSVHRGFAVNVCRNPDCPEKNCVACAGTGKDSRGGQCRCCVGIGKQK